MIEFKDNFMFLAPMAGVSDVGFREIASLYGCDGSVSEMLSCRAMLHNPKKTEYMTICSPQEKLKVGQIFGHESDIMCQSLSSPLLDNFDVIDINMGCPAPKIVKNGDGSALMKNIPLAREIISSCVKASKKPVSVKFRLGFDKDISKEFGLMCQEAGASYVTLHARTTAMGYSGKADYEAIATLKAALKIPVIGNGDVVDQESYSRMLSTGVDGVMIGRGAMGKPWIFNMLKGKPYPKTGEEILKEIYHHIQILRSYYDEKWLTLYMRKHILWYVSGQEGAREYREMLARSESLDKSMEILQKVFEN